MMKKVIKKLLAALLAVAMVCAMAIPAFAENSEGDVDSHHTYSAFQIFKGDVEGNNIKDFKISNVDWGSNIINNSDDFLNKLREADHIGPLFTNAKSAQEVLAVISQWHDSDDYSIAFARFVCHYLYSNDANPTYVVRAGSNALTIPEAKAGYYLFVDTTDFSKDDSYHSYNSFLLMVTKGNWNVPITPKAEKPTVEKKVYDNPDGTSTGGFGSSADHAINEKFQFQLTATLPDSTNRAYDYYDKYSVIFHDTLSDGITYDKDDELDSVVIKSNGNTYNITDSSKYTIDTTDLESQNSFVVNIDVKACAKDAGFDLNDGATITVTYTAHLNDKAYVNTAGGSTSNINKVYLTYSNNPKDESSIGKTPESTPVYVYTYQLNNTKHQDTEKGPALEGACFRLYSDEACTDQSEVQLYQKDGFYYPIKDVLGKEAVEMKSAANGTFNVKGLDAGTYYLKEITPPDGYSACKVIPVTIKADHSRNDQVNLEGSNLTNDIVNIKAGGITLPSTGGIGTTIFYVVGGGLMVAAIVLLVTKKRMENK
ncbi:SpaH/EbpB family LPXTG-anchored major pilin [Faecalibacterium sp. Marseille-Q4896]|jgi:fimbrial isopeptide formation D2 family protein/LPXTG-motif cell wall-anchored protein|uniref:SpaH/EbpB family LPXTG-anchored major pilin n=1 Tax=Faecalibacterium sp. Marseille-Q4896 TaxID=2817018 RepID=UPI001F6110DC|nr:SpaH/EbpB family LPXTG-anchored major pilin [Faecalibacterium sp. Marseille-Q4896]